MAEQARLLGVEAAADSIDFSAKPGLPAAGDLVGFVFPVHGFTTISAMLHFVWRFPRGNRSVSVFTAAATGGCRIGPVKVPGWEGSGLYLPLLVLWLKGYRCAGALPMRSTPENWTALVPACREADCRSMMEATHVEALSFVREMLAGRRVFRGKVSLLFGIIALPASVLYLCFARFFLAKMFFASSRCNGCGLCAQGCPLSAIAMKRGRPYWKLQCESCMRCMNYCPQRAIQASQLLALLFLIFGAGRLAGASTSLLKGCLGGRFAEWTGWLLSLPLSILVLVAVYRLWFFLLGWRPFNLFFEYTTLTRWFRRYREPDTRRSELVSVPVK